jgi:NDP-sugar pyrophosphorylase family protein
MKVVILAAGKSTRMYPLSKNKPKSMLPVDGVPIIEHIVRQLRAHLLTDIIITTHYLPDVIEGHFGDGSKFGVKVQFSHEDVLLETAGSIKRLEWCLSEDFLIIGGSDFLPDIDLQHLIFHHKEKGGIGTIVFKKLENAKLLKHFGQGVISTEGRLRYFKEKPIDTVSDMIHTTYQIYSPRIFQYVPSDTRFSIPFDLIPQLIKNQEDLFAYETSSDFVCVSTKNLYKTANKTLRNRREV